MSVVVLAYHQMGCVGLRTLLERGVKVSAVFTYEDDPTENCWFDSVAEVARNAGVPVFTTEKINDPRWIETMSRLAPEAIFSFHYRHMVGRALRALPRFGCINLHPSLLPKYRGRCPLNWQLINGETHSGVTLHYMVGRADAGDIIAQEAVAVGPDDTAIDLYQKLLPAAAQVLLRHVDAILNGTAPRRPQDESQATTFGGRKPEDGRIDWTLSADEVHNLIRAVAPPWPGAFSDLAGGRLMVWRSKPHAAGPEIDELAGLEPGEVGRAGERVFVGTGKGLLDLLLYTMPPNRNLTAGERAAQSQGVNP